jgi:hypothetical protein
MGESMITDIGIACLVFWSIIGILLTWYVWRIKKFNLGHNTFHKLEEEQETEPLLLENLQENEAVYDLHEETGLNDPEYPKNS